MTWSTPLTAVTNATLTAAQWNASVRDDALETAVAKATAAGQYFVATAANALAARIPVGAGVSTSETTTSTAYAALTTVGPTASSVATGALCFVTHGARIQNSLATAEAYMSYAITGSTSVTANDNFAVLFQAFANNAAGRMSSALLVAGLTPGNNTFTAQYRVSAGTGTFSARQIAALGY